MEKDNEGLTLLAKLQATKSDTLSLVLSHFLNCTSGSKVFNTPHMFSPFQYMFQRLTKITNTQTKINQSYGKM